VDKKEAALQVARLTLLEAERRSRATEKGGSGQPVEAFDVSYGWNRRFVGIYIDGAVQGVACAACVNPH
jgi:hypothetical protein